jgi:hypothetical protein
MSAFGRFGPVNRLSRFGSRAMLVPQYTGARMDSHARGAMLMLATLTLGTGCTALNSSSSTFNAQQSAVEAQHALAQRVPVGTPLPEALQTLSHDGFRCKLEGTPGAPAHRHVCMFSGAGSAGASSVTAAPTPTMWFVTVNSADGATVSSLDVQRLPADLRGR